MAAPRTKQAFISSFTVSRDEKSVLVPPAVLGVANTIYPGPYSPEFLARGGILAPGAMHLKDLEFKADAIGAPVGEGPDPGFPSGGYVVEVRHKVGSGKARTFGIQAPFATIMRTDLRGNKKKIMSVCCKAASNAPEDPATAAWSAVAAYINAVCEELRKELPNLLGAMARPPEIKGNFRGDLDHKSDGDYDGVLFNFKIEPPFSVLKEYGRQKKAAARGAGSGIEPVPPGQLPIFQPAQDMAGNTVSWVQSAAAPLGLDAVLAIDEKPLVAPVLELGFRITAPDTIYVNLSCRAALFYARKQPWVVVKKAADGSLKFPKKLVHDMAKACQLNEAVLKAELKKRFGDKKPKKKAHPTADAKKAPKAKKRRVLESEDEMDEEEEEDEPPRTVSRAKPQRNFHPNPYVDDAAEEVDPDEEEDEEDDDDEDEDGYDRIIPVN